MVSEERELFSSISNSFVGKLMLGICAGITIYASVILGAIFYVNNFVRQTIANQEQLEQIIKTEAKKLKLNTANLAGVLISAGNEASYSVYFNGDIGMVFAGREANVVKVREILYQIYSKIGINDDLKYSDLILATNSIFYGITGWAFK